MIELPTTLIQQDAITDAAQRRGMSVTDWALDCLLTYASNHLGRGLGAWLELEEAYVQRGDYLACGQTQGEGKPACRRIRGHIVEAVAARDTHVGLDTQGQPYSWQHGQG